MSPGSEDEIKCSCGEPYSKFPHEHEVRNFKEERPLCNYALILEDRLDLAVDEFKRIISCCRNISSRINIPTGMANEIKGIAERGQKNIKQHVHVVDQRDRAEARIISLEKRIQELEEELEDRNLEEIEGAIVYRNDDDPSSAQVMDFEDRQ